MKVGERMGEGEGVMLSIGGW
jgi:hypothetical protein